MDLKTLIRLLRERGFTKDGEAILRLTDQEIRRVMDLVRGMLDVVDPDTCPEDLLDLLASLFGVPFLPSAPLTEKLEFLQHAVLNLVSEEDLIALADILGVDLSAYPTLDEKRLAVYEAIPTASEEQIDRCLYTIDASYLLGVMTPDQKRLSIKQAISWYRVRGTELSYQILLRVFSLHARVIPLWTTDYKHFYAEPQGTTVFEGGEWYPTPHYELEFRRWTDHGAVSASIIRLYTQLVREEVQPIQCVLERVSFIQELVDYAEISEEALFEVELPTLDLSPWPACWWQDRGRVFVLEPKRDGSVHVRRDRTGPADGPADGVFLNLGRASHDWNVWAGRYFHARYRDGVFDGYRPITGYFCRSGDPRGPAGLYLRRSVLWHRRSGVHLLVPEDYAGDDPVILCGGEGPADLFLPRDPRACELQSDPWAGGAFFEFREIWSVSAPRGLCSPPIRDGSWDATRSSALIFADECFGLEHEFSEDVVEWGEDEGALEVSWDEENFCTNARYRSGVEWSRWVPLRGLFDPRLRDGSWDYSRDSGTEQRHASNPLRDGSGGFDRTAFAFVEVHRRGVVCYPDDFAFEVQWVDVVEIDDTTPLDVPINLVDDAPEPTEEAELVLEYAEFYTNAYFRNLCCGPEYQGERWARDFRQAYRDGSWEYTRTDGWAYRSYALLRARYKEPVPCRDVLGYPPRGWAFVHRDGTAEHGRDGSVTQRGAAPDRLRDGSVALLRGEAYFLEDGLWKRGYVDDPVREVEFTGDVTWEVEADAFPEPQDASTPQDLNVDFGEDGAPVPVEGTLSGDVTVALEDRVCLTAVYRDDWPGARTLGQCYRFQYYPERNRPDCTRAGRCVAPRASGAVTCARQMATPRDGSVLRWSGETRDGDPLYLRDVITFIQEFRRRGDTLCYEDAVDLQFSAELGEDQFCYTQYTRDTADFIRDGTACMYRDGENCCTPGDTLEIIEHRCLRWDEGCHWDTPGVHWDPI